PRRGHATRRGVRALRARDRLSHDHALDEQRAGGRTPHLRGGRLPAHPQGAPHELRSRSRGRDLGEAALTRRALATAAAAATGVLLTIAGVALALGEKAFRHGDPHGWLGEAAAFGAAVSGAVCSVLYRPYVRRYPTVPVSALAMVAAVAFLAALAAREGFFAGWPHLTGGGWAAVLFIGVSSGVGYFLWLWALGHAPATEVTVFLALSPFTAALLGALL